MGESIKRLFANWFDQENFNVWKLQTAWDYVFFIALLAAGFLVFFLIIQVMKKNRNHTHALKKTSKKLNRLGGKGACCYTEKLVRAQDGSQEFFDLIHLANDRIYVVKVFHYGLEARGDVKDKTWTFNNGKEVWKEKNPLPALNRQKDVLSRVLNRAGLHYIGIEPLVIFADNYGTTQFRINGLKEKSAVPLRMLRSWRKSNKLDRAPMKLAEVKAALEAAFVENGTPDMLPEQPEEETP